MDASKLGSKPLGRAFALVAVLLAVLLGIPSTSWAVLEDCEEFNKQVSIDGGATWFDADDAASAPTQVVGGGALYRFVLRNCFETKVCLNTRIDDPDLDIGALVPGSTGPGVVQPTEQIIITSTDPGFENLDQPDRCDTPGVKKNKATETTTVADPPSTTGNTVMLMDEAYINCDEKCGNEVVDGELGETCDPPGSIPDATTNANLCRDDCTYCGDGVRNGDEECDDLADPECTDTCMKVSPLCSIEVDKFCSVPVNPVGPTCSDIKAITALSMIWDGPDGVNVMTPSGTISGVQNGDEISFSTPSKDTVINISGAVNGSSTFHVSCSDEDMDGPEDCGKAQGNGKSTSAGLNLWLFESMTGQKGTLDCTVPAADPTSECKLVAQSATKKKKKKKKAVSTGGTTVKYTYVIRNVGSTDIHDITAVDTVLGEVDGSPIDLLEPNEEVTLMETVSNVTSGVTNTVFVSGATEGGQVCEDDASATVTVEIPPASCADGKPAELVFEVAPGPCGASSHGQGTKFTCSGEPVGGPFAVVASKSTVTPSSANANQAVSVKPTGSGFDANTVVNVIGANGTQTMSIHTSCSQPLNVGDRFGSLILKTFVPQP